MKDARSHQPFEYFKPAVVGWYALFLASCLPALIALLVQTKHWVNIPIWDEWDTPGAALLHYVQQTLTWRDLFDQHNESRKVFPRLIYIAITSVAGWDVRHGMVLTFVCACVASVFAFVHLRRREGSVTHQVLFAWLLVNLLLFAPSQYENYLSGFTWEIFVPVLCLFGCVAINLSNWRLPWKVAGNCLLAIFASYSFAHGIFLWPLGIPIATREECARPGKTWLFWACYVTYSSIAVVSVICYFVGYQRPAIAPLAAGLNQIPQVIEFVVVWLGAALRSDAVGALVPGLLATAACCVTLFLSLLFLYRNKTLWKHYYPWLLLIMFSLASGLLTAIGRVNLGTDVVFGTSGNGFLASTRYNATSVFAYFGLVGLLFNLYIDWIRYDQVWRSRFPILITAYCTLFAVAWTFMLSEESARVRRFQVNARRARTAVMWITALPENPELLLAYPYLNSFQQRIEEMHRAGLLKLPPISDRIKQIISSVPAVNNAEAGSLDSCSPLGYGRFRFTGWARNPTRNEPADYVVLGYDAPDQPFRPFTAIPTGHTRPDLVNLFKSVSMKQGGFDQDVDLSKLPTGDLQIKAWAVDLKRQEIFPVGGTLRVAQPSS